MNHIFAIALIVLVFHSSYCLADDGAALAEARSAAESWLKLADEKAYKESWGAAASVFRQSMSELQWADTLGKARAPLGAMSRRVLKNSTFTRTLPGAPEGEYVVLQFETQFEKSTTVETIVPMKDVDGNWRVSGYFVQ